MYVTVELVDKNETRNPKAEDSIHFEIEGPGTIVGVGNANPISLESYQQPLRRAWQGRWLVVVKPGKETGNILLKATSPGIKSSEIILKSANMPGDRR